MIKQFILWHNYTNIYIIAYVFIFFNLMAIYITSTNTRIKFTMFVVNLINLSLISLNFNLDGLVLILLISELTLCLIFISIYYQLYTYLKEQLKAINIYIFFFIIFFYKNISYKSLNYVSYYKSIQNINHNDFFIYYNFLFENFLLITIFLTLILTFFSFFIIILYINIKYIKNSQKIKSKKIYFIKKQSIVNQVSSKIYIKNFQK